MYHLLAISASESVILNHLQHAATNVLAFSRNMTEILVTQCDNRMTAHRCINAKYCTQFL